MKKSILSLLTVLMMLPPTQAGWEPRGMCYVWTGSAKPETPVDMLTGEVYDYNRSPEGDFFTYSGVYSEGGSRKNHLKTARKIRNSGAINPTGSPDVHGQFAYTLKMLMQGKDNVLNKYYKYPFSIATPQEVAEGIHADKEGYVVRKLKSTPFCNDAFNGVTGGTPIEVEEGKTYPIEIIIGECGRHGFYYLMTQEVTKDKKAPLMLFRTNEDWPVSPQDGEKGPAYSKDSPVWKTVTAEKKKKKAKKMSPGL